MIRLLELLSHFNWLLLPETTIETLWHTDWSAAYRRNRVGGLAAEAIRSLIGSNTWTFYVSLDSGWSGREIERLLARYGIKLWGKGFAHGELFFRVRKDKAAWAQYLMLQAGIPLQHRLLGTPRGRQPRRFASSRKQPIGSYQDYGEALEQHLDGLVNRIASILGL